MILIIGIDEFNEDAPLSRFPKRNSVYDRSRQIIIIRSIRNKIF